MRTAKLFVKGIREPIELTEEQGDKAKKVKDDTSIDDSQTVSIADGRWTGEKKDIRYIIFEEKTERVEATEYSPKEMFDFEEELKIYCIKIGDNEYKRFVNVFVKGILDKKENLFWSSTTKNALLSARKIVMKIEKESERNDVARKEAEKIVKLRLVGILTKKGEQEYLIEQKAIRVEEGGGFVVLKHPDGSVPFSILNNKLSKYSDWKSRREYASGKEMEGYAEMSGHVVKEMETGYEE